MNKVDLYLNLDNYKSKLCRLNKLTLNLLIKLIENSMQKESRYISAEILGCELDTTVEGIYKAIGQLKEAGFIDD